MGEYVSLKIKELEIWNWKNYLSMDIVGLFFIDDDIVKTNNVKYEEDDEDEDPHIKYEFVTTVQKAKDRLDALGYSLSAFEMQFEKNKYGWIYYEAFLHHLHIDIEDCDEIKIKRINKYVTFSKWKNSVKKFVDYGLKHSLWRPNVNELKINTECDKIIYCSNESDEFGYFGMTFDDVEAIKFTFRLILEYCNNDDFITLDVSNLIGWTYNSIEEIIIGETIEKNIVLVEGTSDKTILEFALKKIYPHLYNLFYFMDFNLGNKTREGSCDMLSKNIVTFIASKLKAKFIAIYDNDTVGYFSKLKILDDFNNDLPSNFRILNYPEIDRARNYPTIGTNKKIIYDNVNYRACSIEMYLPKKLIVDDNGNYFPIQWSALKTCKLNNNTLSEYQGVIIEKEKIKKQFMELMKKINEDFSLFNIEEWKELKKVVDSIVFAFK